MSESALVVVPTYNERGNLPTLISGLMKHDNVRVMVVDDQSPDGTGALADELSAQYPGRIEVMHRTDGGDWALAIDGLRSAGRARRRLCQMDADPSHDPAKPDSSPRRHRPTSSSARDTFREVPSSTGRNEGGCSVALRTSTFEP